MLSLFTLNITKGQGLLNNVFDPDDDRADGSRPFIPVYVQSGIWGGQFRFKSIGNVPGTLAGRWFNSGFFRYFNGFLDLYPLCFPTALHGIF